METTLTGKTNKRKLEAKVNPLWNAGLYSQIVTFDYKGNIWNLSITTSEAEHKETLKSINECSIVKSYQIFLKYSHADFSSAEKSIICQKVYK
tara:strand:- start:1172 stop:1450 length:279 start_codon:yes stop_codon:yes gene_type:complete